MWSFLLPSKHFVIISIHKKRMFEKIFLALRFEHFSTTSAHSSNQQFPCWIVNSISAKYHQNWMFSKNLERIFLIDKESENVRFICNFLFNSRHDLRILKNNYDLHEPGTHRGWKNYSQNFFYFEMFKVRKLNIEFKKLFLLHCLLNEKSSVTN